MNLKNFKSLLLVLPFAILVFALHKLFFYLFGWQEIESHLVQPLLNLYLFFAICSLIIIFILTLVKHKNIDSVGQVFILLTCIKMGSAYIMLRPISEFATKNVAFEKKDFFIVFAVFLAIETILTIRLLNNKQ